jgi:hypothetical protein
MKEVFTDPEFTVVGFLKAELQAAGIACFIQNQHTNLSMTGVASALFWPALCISNDADLPAAQAIVQAFVAARRQSPDTETSPPPEWTCAHCGEAVPGSFERCWQCEKPRAGVPPS